MIFMIVKLIKKILRFAVEFVKCPSEALSYAHLFFLRHYSSSTIIKLQELTQKYPLVLQIETTNMCNAACVFCAYSKMERKKGVMDLPRFEKVITDYVIMGGGPVSLTPIMGDALLDPHLLERIKILKTHSEINQITLTTNAIALKKYSDEEVCLFLETFFCIVISIGGLDADTYKMMYGVDRFAEVSQAMERILSLRAKIKRSAHIHFAFRTNTRNFLSDYKRQLDTYRQQGVFISHIWTYENYTGVVESDEKLNLIVKTAKNQKVSPCVLARIEMCVCWDGRITACGCADFEGNLMIGHVDKNTLSDVWFGEKRLMLLESFGKETLNKDCLHCTAYQPDRVFAYPYFKGVQPHRPLPLDFYQQFWGG